mmetsp:Transcript_5870/g.12543  ORF Transcript_5870/g.12543 Transcript_5870/m.12543 type:complete len:158 (-) Transcript_5870:682-1155(-)
MSNTHSPNPLVWTIVNLVVVFVSVVLLYDISFAFEDRKERPGAVGEYLAYNFVTTVLWVVEVSLRTHQVRINKEHKKLELADDAWIIVELLAALYFVGDSLHLVIEWKLKDEDLTEDSMDVVVGIISYSYITVATYLDYKRSLRGEYNQVQPSESTV